MFKEDKASKTLVATIFSVLTVIVIVMGYLFNSNIALSDRITQNNDYLTKKVNKVSVQYTNIETQLSQIQTDIGWLKRNSQ